MQRYTGWQYITRTKYGRGTAALLWCALVVYTGFSASPQGQKEGPQTSYGEKQRMSQSLWGSASSPKKLRDRLYIWIANGYTKCYRFCYSINKLSYDKNNESGLSPCKQLRIKRTLCSLRRTQQLIINEIPNHTQDRFFEVSTCTTNAASVSRLLHIHIWMDYIQHRRLYILHAW